MLSTKDAWLLTGKERSSLPLAFMLMWVIIIGTATSTVTWTQISPTLASTVSTTPAYSSCVYHVFIICLSCVYHVFVMCLSCLRHVFIMCLSCVHHVFIMCLSCVYHKVHAFLSYFTLHVYWILIVCLLFIHEAFIVYLFVRVVYTASLCPCICVFE